MLVRYPDARLGRRAEPRQVDLNLVAIGTRLLEAASAAEAYGLAAVHIGVVAPVVVISVDPDPRKRDYRTLYNPEIVKLGPHAAAGPEGSVAMPGVQVEIVRSTEVEVAFDDASRVRSVLALSGLPARIAQHEIDQVNGVFFIERLSRLKRDLLLKKWRKRATED